VGSHNAIGVGAHYGSKINKLNKKNKKTHLYALLATWVRKECGEL
jgi:hypothetical protein